MDKKYIFISKGDEAQMVEHVMKLTQGMMTYLALPLILFYFHKLSHFKII